MLVTERTLLIDGVHSAQKTDFGGGYDQEYSARHRWFRASKAGC